MITLQTLKDRITELEESLPDGIQMSDIPIQRTFMDRYDKLSIEMYDYLGFVYASIKLE